MDTDFKRMRKNAKKAIEEHRKKAGIHVAFYTSVRKGVPSARAMLAHGDLPSLSFSHHRVERKGSRASMEDSSFYKEIEPGILAGVFDGHGGYQVSKYASKEFADRFLSAWLKLEKNTKAAFELLIDEIHQEVSAKPEWNHMGSTAVICFLEKNTHLVYTATIGDSEANIYRKGHSIPLSCVRDWSSKKEAKRASIALKDPSIAKKWPKAANPKLLRFYNEHFTGLNVSRAIGDVSFTGNAEAPGVIHKPKVTVNQVKVGDVLILACDGLKDYVPEGEIVQQVTSQPEGENLAEILTNHALYVRASTDNVTVIAIRVS